MEMVPPKNSVKKGFWHWLENDQKEIGYSWALYYLSSGHSLGFPESEHCDSGRGRLKEWEEREVKTNAVPTPHEALELEWPFRVAPNWAEMARPWYPHVNESLHVACPRKGGNLEQGRSLPLRQPMKVLKTEGHLLTTFPGAGQQVLSWREITVFTAFPQQVINFLLIFLINLCSYDFIYFVNVSGLIISSQDVNLTTIQRTVAVPSESTFI